MVIAKNAGNVNLDVFSMICLLPRKSPREALAGATLRILLLQIYKFLLWLSIFNLIKPVLNSLSLIGEY